MPDDPMPKPNVIITIAVVLAIGFIIVAAGTLNVILKIDQVIATQEATQKCR
jgi:hypothetical protein